MNNLVNNKEVAPALTPIEHRSQIKVNACGGINSIAEDAITFVHRFACILKAKPERPPVIVLSTARTESEARQNLTEAFDGKMRLIWAGRLPRKAREVRYV
ncbi:host cell division inhibitor Icd-like protein [Serratia bockelmannii]|uniref:host cell division inhibitor Icd-like protein n=1 Tax=Serratia bockelmannii TaxID=2703793 RepID=UPI00313EF9DF